jgi:hypothetical protein
MWGIVLVAVAGSVMRLLHEPFPDIVGFAFAYVGSVAALMMINDAAMPRLELPWTWHWVFWGMLFAPAAIVTIIVRVMTDHYPKRLTLMYGVALLIIVVDLTSSSIFPRASSRVDHGE